MTDHDFIVGHSIDGGRDPVRVDVPRLIDSRCLVTGMSGSGKSWLIRLLAERCGAQLVVLDPEGEFVTLAERLDVVIVGDGGSVAADPKTAGLLARRLLELRVSAVVDLSELEWHARRRWARLFCESLLHAPRKLWTPLLVFIDEAHMFCPERSSGEAESTNSVIALASQGRKRGFSPVLATQRLSKLHKDAAAELGNVLIGRIGLDVDQKRAADVLQLSKDQRAHLRDLKDGQFWAFGPALTPAGPAIMVTDEVRTTHPKPGDRSKIVPPSPSVKIKSVLGEFEGLDGEAREEARTIEDLKRQLSDLKRSLRKASEGLDTDAIRQAVEEESKRWRAEIERLRGEAAEYVQGLRRDLGKALSGIKAVEDGIDVSWLLAGSRDPAPVPRRRLSPTAAVAGISSAARDRAPMRGDSDIRTAPEGMPKLQKGTLKLLGVLVQFPEGQTRRAALTLAGYSTKKSTARGIFAELRRFSCIVEDGDLVFASEFGKTLVPEPEPIPTGPEVIDHWRQKLGGPDSLQVAVYNVLVDLNGKAISPEQLQERSGAFGSTYRGAIALMRKFGLIDQEGKGGPVRLGDHLVQHTGRRYG